MKTYTLILASLLSIAGCNASEEFTITGCTSEDSLLNQNMPIPDENTLKQAENGNAKAQYLIGWTHYKNENFKEAELWSLRAAEQEQVGAQLILGELYRKGLGGQKDLKRANNWYVKAAKQGNAIAQFYVGMKHDTEQNPKEAARWYRKAAEQEFLPAQRLLGKLYISGEGVPKDFIEAGKWFKLAAEQGDADAQYNLGVMHENGEGFQENIAEAAKWYQKAAEQGHGDAQYNLGLWYMNGNGVKKDVVLAYVLLNLAASNSDYESKILANQERDSIQKLLNTSQLEEALLLSKNIQRPVIYPTEEKHCSVGLYRIPTVSNTGSVHEIKNP